MQTDFNCIKENFCKRSNFRLVGLQWKMRSQTTTNLQLQSSLSRQKRVHGKEQKMKIFTLQANFSVEHY